MRWGVRIEISLYFLRMKQLEGKGGEEYLIDYKCKLGSGGFGDVFKGLDKFRNCFVALKRIKESCGNVKSVIREESSALRTVKHPNVIELFQVLEIAGATFIVTQYCEGGNLDNQIIKGIPELNCFQYLKQIVQGMAAVNNAKLIHRDIKPQNMLFSKDKVIKICDFGLSRRIAGDDINKIQKFSSKGTPLYCCPQILKTQMYSAKCDVWSTGVILVQMLTKTNPFQNAKNIHNLNTLHERLKGNEFQLEESKIHPWFKHVLTKMLAYQEHDRWSFYELQNHISNSSESMFSCYSRFDSIKLKVPVISQNANDKGQGTIVYSQPIQGLQQKTLILVSPKSRHAGIISRQEQKLVARQENKRLLTNLRCYAQYIYNRGKLVADIGRKYFQAKEVSKSRFHKYMVLFLSISIYIKSVEKIVKIIQRESVTLPDLTEIVYGSFDQVTTHEFEEMRKTYQIQMEKEIGKFSGTISQIENKVHSLKFQQEFSKMIEGHRVLITNISEIKENQSKEKMIEYQGKFRDFFMKQCLETDTESIDEVYLRIYFTCLKVSNLEQTIPWSRYKDNYIINQIIDDQLKLQVPRIREQIKALNAKLLT